ncbi:MAG: LEA14-like dessication related protein [Planctomycetota bacterium]|jgi:LEA14-like dessication related protein
MGKTTMTTEQFGELQLESIFIVKNPNTFDVEITESEKTLRLESGPLKIETDNVPRLVPAKGEINIPARISIEGKDVITALKENPDDGTTPATFQLAVRVNHRELEANQWYSAQWHGPMPIMVPPTLKFLGIEKESLSALQADLHLILELNNPNNYQIQVRSIALDLKINEVSFGKIESTSIEEGIAVGQRIQLKVSHSYRLSGEGSQIFEVLAHAKELQVEVKGSALLGFESPLSPVQTILSASGTARP